MNINYLNEELEGGKFQAEEHTACADNCRQGRTQCVGGTERSLMWLEEKGRKRRLRRARIVSLLKRIRFYWSMVIFLRNFKQQSGMIIFVFWGFFEDY